MSDPLVVKDITGVDNKTILDCYKNEFTEESIEKILDALRPHGRWLTHQAGMMLWEECNQCKAQVGTIGMNYCPNCGAKMDGGVDDDK